MAIIKYGPIISDVRGSIGGVVFSRGKNGAFARSRIKPTAGQSNELTRRRASMGTLAAWWRNVIPQANRDDWEAAANNTVFRDRLGRDYQLNGFQCFMRQLELSQYFPLPPLPGVSPIEPLIISFPAMQLTWHAGTSEVRLQNVPSQNPYQSITIVVYSSPDFSPTINKPRGPWTKVSTPAITNGAPFDHTLPSTSYAFRPCRRFYRLMGFKNMGDHTAPAFLSILIPAP